MTTMQGFGRDVTALFGPGQLYEGLDKPLYNVILSDDKEKFHLVFQDGTRASFVAEGDCCSRSWIEHLEAPLDVRGRTIVDVDDATIDAPDGSADDNDYDVLKVYKTTFRLDNGDTIALEYRNSSNGYYGGYLVRVNQ